MKNDEIARRVIELTNRNQTMDELHETLLIIAHTIGGMVCHFDKSDRTQVLMSLTESLGTGLMLTAKSMGEPSDLEMIIGKASD